MKQENQFVIRISILFICAICQLCGALKNNLENNEHGKYMYAWCGVSNHRS